MKMKQHIIGIFTTVCLTVSLFIFLDSPNLNEKMENKFREVLSSGRKELIP